MLLLDLSSGGLHAGLIGDVERQCFGVDLLATKLPYRLLAIGGVARADEYLRAGLAEQAGGGDAEALVGTRDESDLHV